MIDQLESAFNFHQQALGLRQQRHQVLAANIANADTPNYKARDIDFASELKKAVDGSQAQQQNVAWHWRVPPIAIWRVRGLPGKAQEVQICCIEFLTSQVSMATPSTWIASEHSLPTMRCAIRLRSPS